MTMQEKFAAALVARGETEVPTKSRKYRTFTRTWNDQRIGYFFLGKAGALRVGARSSSSIPVSDADKARILEAST
jgi:hypothetical protein